MAKQGQAPILTKTEQKAVLNTFIGTPDRKIDFHTWDSPIFPNKDGFFSFSLIYQIPCLDIKERLFSFPLAFFKFK